MRRVVSYSYFRHRNSVYEKEKGNSALQFEIFLPLVVRAHAVLWPGWTLRLSHDGEVALLPYFRALAAMHREGLVELVHHGNAETLCGAGGMLERLRPVWEGDWDTVVCRDIDVIPAPFDRRAVEEWLASGRAVHVIHWAGAHSGVMGGTTSVRSARFRELVACRGFDEFLARGTRKGLTYLKHGDDQHLLNQHWKAIAGETLVHDLHHRVGDMPGAEVRTQIMDQNPDDILHASFDHGAADHLSKGCGVCWDPREALAFYAAIDHPAVRRIQEIEREQSLRSDWSP